MKVIDSPIRRVGDITHAAIKKLGGEVLMSPKSMGEIAELIGKDRQTVGRRIKRDTMPLDGFLELAWAVDADPIQILQDTIKEFQKEGE